MKRIVWGMLIGMVVISGVKAQQQGLVPVLTFEQAVQLAMKNGVLLNTQRNNLQYSQMQRVTSIAGMGPNISVNSSVSTLDGNSFNQQQGRVVNGVRDNVTASVNANINLFSGFNRMNQIKQYASALDAQTYFVNRTAQDVLNTVSTQYLTVMLDVELLRIAKENFDALNKQLEQVTEQVNLGARGPVDQYNQDAQTKAAELRYVQAEIQMNIDKASLAQTLLIDPLEKFDVERPNWDVNAIGNDNLNTEELAERAKQYRGDYQRAVKQENAQRFAMNAAKGTMMPSLFAFGSIASAYNYQRGVQQYLGTDSLGNPIENPNYPRPFSEQFRTNNVQKQYGVQLTIPIFQGLQNRTTYVQQKVLYQNTQINKNNVEYQIRNDVVKAVLNYDGARKAFAITTVQLKSAEMAFSLEQERYNLGLTNFVDYINANRVLVQSQTDKAQAEYRLVFQKIMIEYAVGTLRPEDLTKQ